MAPEGMHVEVGGSIPDVDYCILSPSGLSGKEGGTQWEDDGIGWQTMMS